MGVYGQSGTPITGNPPACRIYRSTTLSVPHNAVTAIPFDVERFDNDLMHSTVSLTDRITFNTAGVYVIHAFIVFAASTAGQRTLQIVLNGDNAKVLVSTDQPPNPTVGNGTAIQVTTLWKFAAADFIQAVAYQTSGGALNLIGSTPTLAQTEFAVGWVGLGT